jgi:Protein of unknown function (DUF3644)
VALRGSVAGRLKLPSLLILLEGYPGWAGSTMVRKFLVIRLVSMGRPDVIEVGVTQQTRVALVAILLTADLRVRLFRIASLSRSSRLLQNAESALISAIETYNKPTFAYREETVAILALNAWELLLKAKLLEIKENKPSCLYIYYRKSVGEDELSKKLYVKKNRTGNKMTIGIDGCISRLEKEGISVAEPIKKNLEALSEIRDNAMHYINASPQLYNETTVCFSSTKVGSNYCLRHRCFHLILRLARFPTKKLDAA